MRTTILLLLIGALLVGPTDRVAAGKDKKDKKDKKGRTQAQVKDICKDCVDPYNPTAERARFLTAAGVDSELDAKEFETDKARDDGFVRRFDTWKGMLAFDKDSNNTIDWFEADAYRSDVRKRVLLVYDANKDGRLKDKERESANKALSAGKLSKVSKKSGTLKVGKVRGRPSDTRGGGSRPSVRTGPLIIRSVGGGQGSVTIGGSAAVGQLSQEMRLRMFDKNKDGKLDNDEKAAMAKWEKDSKKRREEWARKAAKWQKLNDKLRKKHDKNGDGQLDEAERKAYYEEYRKRAKIVQWDKDGDGQLSDAERQEMEAKQAEWKKRAEESRRKWMLQQWDKDKDGQMSEEETAAMEANQAEMKKRAERYRRVYEELRKKHDKDGDGKLDEDERKAYYEEYRQRAKIMRWDKDGDGRLDEDERKTMEEERSRWRQSSSVLINGRPVQAGGGVRVWSSRDGSTRGVIIMRRGGQDQQDE